MSFPTGFIGNIVSADGNVFGGKFEDEAAIWDGEQVIKILEGQGFEYSWSYLYEITNDGNKGIGVASIDVGGFTKSMPFVWESGAGVTFLECDSEDSCNVNDISADGGIMVGDIQRHGKSYPVLWDENGYIQVLDPD